MSSFLDVSDTTRPALDSSFLDDSDEDQSEDEEIRQLQQHVEEQFRDTTTGREQYLELCHQLHIIPASVILSKLSSTDMDLTHHGLRAKGSAALAACLKVNTHIQKLHLADNFICNDGCLALCEALLDSGNITHVNLDQNRLGSQAAEALCTVLLRSKRLEYLSLEWNDLNDTAAAHLFEGLAGNSGLTELHLAHNEIGARAIHTALNSNTNPNMLSNTNSDLKLLDLSWNRLGSVGGIAVGNSLPQAHLTVLDLSWNGLDAKAGVAIANGLAQNQSLLVCNLTHNRICGTEAATAFQKALMAHPKLHTFSLDENPFTIEDGTLIVTGLVNSKVQQTSVNKLSFDWHKIEGVPSWFNFENPSGFYKLDLEKLQDRFVALQLLDRLTKYPTDTWVNPRLDQSELQLPSFADTFHLPKKGVLTLEHRGTPLGVQKDPLSSDSLQHLLFQLELSADQDVDPITDAKRVQLITQVCENSYFTVSQVKKLISTFEVKESDLVATLLKVLYPRVLDRGYFIALLQEFPAETRDNLRMELQLGSYELAPSTSSS